MRRAGVVLILTVGVLVAFIGVNVAGDAQVGAIAGFLTDTRSGNPIVAAWVAIAENNLSAATDSMGSFVIENLPPGSYTLIVTHPEYGTIKGLDMLAVTVASGSTATVRLAFSRLTGESAKPSDIRYQTVAIDHFSHGGDRTADVESKAGDKKEKEADQAKRATGRRRTSTAGGRSSVQETPAGECSPFYPDGGYINDDRHGSPPPSGMFFKDYGTNRFVQVSRERYSTFAVDVDDASYTLARRYLREGHLPPSAAIRIEEFINHFDYGYNNPSERRFRVFAEITDSPFDRQKSIMKIGIKGREVARQDRRPLNLTLVVDVSGSMGCGNRMELVKESLRMLLNQLDGNDRVGMVAYGSTACTVLEPIPADRRGEILRAIDHLQPGGSTYAEAGLKLGYQMANRQHVNGHNNVVVLCSDGVANVGRTSPEAIMCEIERFARRGITLSTFGFGMGNYNDFLLEQLAQKGNGRYAYVNNRREAREAFAESFVSNMQLLARDVKVQVEFDAEAVKSYRLIGYENRDVPDHRFRDNTQEGGEVGAGHEITALYELVLTGDKSAEKVATVYVRWKDIDEAEVAELSRDALLCRHWLPFKRCRPELRLAVIAGRFAELLKGTVYAGETSYQDLLRLAEPLRGQLPSEQIEELLELIRLAHELSTYHTSWRESCPSGDHNYRR